MAESTKIKAEANALYSSQDYENAIAKYEEALSSCPNYLHYERAVLQSNMAACHLKQEQWKEGIKIATKALDGLAKLEKPAAEDSGDVEEEIVSSGASRAAQPEDQRKTDIQRIRTKALLRRARARAEAGGWQNLSGAEEDYKALAAMEGLTAADKRTVQSQLRALPPRTKAAQEAEMSEMWGKLRQLGDGMLKPFGLSTDNFQMVQDEKTGGYSMNFTQANAPKE